MRARDEGQPGEWNAEWFPPGIHYSCKIEKAEAKHAATSSSQEGHMEWMTSDEVSSKDLHQAMFNMCRSMRTLNQCSLC